MSKQQKIIFGVILILIIFPKILEFLFIILFVLFILVIILFFNQKQKGRDDLKSFFEKLIFQKKSQNKKEQALNYDQIFKSNFISNFNFMGKLKFSFILGFFLIAIFVFVIIDGLVNVPAGHVAVIYDRGKGVLNQELPEGLHLKIPFWQTATLFTTKKQVFTMAGQFQGIQDEDAVHGRSKDGQDVTVDVSVTYQVQGKDASFLLQEFLSENGYRITTINPAARSLVYDAISKFNALELVSEKRNDFSNLIQESLKAIYANNKIILHEVFVRNVSFSPEFSKAIEEKQIAEQNIKTAENRKREAEQIKQKKIIEAQAEAEAIRLKGETLKANPQVIQFEFVQKMAPNINWGVLPDNIVPLLDLKGVTN